MTAAKIIAVDLGLPSGTLWTDRNLGADAPENPGDYFRFGETVPFTKNSTEYAFDDIDGSIAGTERDAATVILGKGYHTPTFKQIEELIRECKRKWVIKNGTKGVLVTGPNGNSIFFPACGYRRSSALNVVGPGGCCWSSTPFNTNYGRGLYYNWGNWGWNDYTRACGFPIRPVMN